MSTTASPNSPQPRPPAPAQFATAQSAPAQFATAQSAPAPDTRELNGAAAIEAYHRFAREGSPSEVTDYYRGPEALVIEAPPPPVLIAESLIPTGKPRLAPRPDKPRGPKVAAALVVLALAAGGGYYATQHKAVPKPKPVVLPTVVDQSGTGTSGVLKIVATETAGAPYTVIVPSGWSAETAATRPGGSHIDVTITQPVLHLTVTVRSSPVGTPDTGPAGTPVRSSLRVFGLPAAVVLVTPTAVDPPTRSRVATVTRDGIRYAVTLTVPTASATRDFVRAGVAVAGLRAPSVTG